jgi:hypothetical protein
MPRTGRFPSRLFALRRENKQPVSLLEVHHEYRKVLVHKACIVFRHLTVVCTVHVLFLLSGLLKAIPVTGREGLWGCEMLRIPHCLDNRLTNDGKVVSLKHRPRSAPSKHYFSASGTHSC